MINLTNSWMNDPTYLAQSAHFFGAITAVMIASYFWGKKGCLWAAGIFATAATIKEFWYDLNFELPKQTFWDSTLDYTFYLVGVAVAVITVLLVKKPNP